MQTGTRQDGRLPEALRSGYFQPDELTLAERIRLSLDQAESLRFLSHGGMEAGLWNEALRRDESVLLADLAAYPQERESRDFESAMAQADENALSSKLCLLTQRYDAWCQGLQASDSIAARQVGDAMQAQIEQGLSDLLAPVLARESWNFAPLHAAWKKADRAEPGRCRQELCRAWLGLGQAIARIQPIAAARLDESLESKRHDPALGLLLATLQLFQYSRQPLNDFPNRLTEFYFGDLLHMQPRPPAVERVHLLLKPDARSSAQLRIAEGQIFVGSKDASGQAIAFAAEHEVELSDIRVAALHSLRIERDELISPEREFGYATRIKVEALRLQGPKTVSSAAPSWWPLLGGRAKGSSAQGRDATLGLAIASPLLALGEGRRVISLSIQLAHPADDDESLRALLQSDSSLRTEEWLTQVFERYAQYERQYFPPRPRPNGGDTAETDIHELAHQAWQRSSSFDDDVQLCFLLALCLTATDAVSFAQSLGRLFAAWLTAPRENLRAGDLAALRLHAAQWHGDDPERRLEPDDPLILIHAPASPSADGNAAQPDRALIFDQMLAGVWQAWLSTAKSWLTLDGVRSRLSPGAAAGTDWGGGIDLTLQLGPEQAPISPCQPAVHGSPWPEMPVLQLRLQTQSRIYAYGILSQWLLREMRLNTAVSGLGDIVLYNQSGRLDPSKPFQPFGPAPKRGTYLVWGSRELASKPLRSLRMNIEWSGLPESPGGFSEHYAGYPSPPRNEDFRVRVKALLDGQWQSGDGLSLPLFRTRTGRRAIASANSLNFPESDLRRWHRPIAPIKAGQPFLFDLHSRNGFFRLDLEEPARGFGHADYPRLLTEVLTHNARRRRPRALPSEPHTPTIASLSLDYEASEHLTLQTEDGSAAVFQLHPFGLQAIQSARSSKRFSLLPRFCHEGNLYIGLEGSDPQGVLSLLFELRKEEAAERWSEAPARLHWAAWGANGWQAIPPEHLLADSTRGMLHSGIVRIRLPDGMKRGCPQLPDQLFWLRLAADWGLDQLAGLCGVHAHALSARRVQAAGPQEAEGPLPPGTIERPRPSVAGLRAVIQAGPSFGRREAETSEQRLTRCAERLRHKQRAVSAWDYEHLLLDAFPEVHMVKCYPHQSLAQALGSENRPGHVLIVVVPEPHRASPFHSTEAPRLDAATLEAMRAYLSERSPAGSRVLVRNAAYERIQVRCSLRPSPGVHAGAALQQANQALVEYLSPWHPGGYRARFDWRIDADELEAHLRSLPCVAALGRFSLLHIVCRDDRFHVLRDTARTRASAPSRTLGPEQAWSLALPVSHHLIELSDAPSDRAPQVTGLARLEVGNTFIVGRSFAATPGGK